MKGVGEIIFKEATSLVLTLYSKESVKNILILFKTISSLITLFTIAGFFLYSISYCFLYGYYFSGEIEKNYSIMDLITNIVPFDFYTILPITLFLVFSVIFLINSIQIIKKRISYQVFTVILFLCVFQFCLTYFFTGKITWTSLIFFISIWIVPLILTIIFYWSYRLTQNGFSAISGTILGLEISILFYSQFKFDQELFTLFYYILFSIFGIIFSYFSRRNFKMRILLNIPYLSFIALMYNLLINHSIISVKSLIPYGIAVILSVIWGYFPPIIKNMGNIEVNKIKIDEHKSQLDKFLGWFGNMDKTILLLIFSIVILFIVIIIPRASVITGKHVRSSVPANNINLETIEATNLPNGKMRGILVVNRDGVLYIANTKWELVRLKIDKFRTAN